MKELQSNTSDVSFIIPSYNSCKTIGCTLKSIFNLRSFENVKDVIVVDSSDDGKTRELFKDDVKLKVVLLDKKTSPANGRNIGAGHAQGGLLCFIDSDVYLDENWLENILQEYEDGRLVGCGSVSMPDFQQDSKLAAAQLYLQFNETLCTGESRVAAIVPSCNMFCQKELFLRVGGFPSLRASEDTMFCLGLAGTTKIWFVPSAKVFHIFREEFKDFKYNQILLGQYVGIYRRMYYKSWIYKGVFPLLLFPGFLFVKLTRMVARIHKAGNGHFRKFLSSAIMFIWGIIYWSRGFLKGCFTKI